MPTIELIMGDCLEKMKDIPDGSIDAVITDPPYGLSFMGKHWDRGVPSVEFWVEMIRVLKSGGYLLSFSGTRTYHRMAVAIEDAGFEIRDMIEWVYGSGFPKSLNIGKAVDKMQGNEREDLGYNLITPRQRERGTNRVEWTGALKRKIDNNVYGKDERDLMERMKVTKGTSEWEGWGTALKPAHEPICMARKPLSEKTVAENVLKYGTGGINIDESRVGTGDKLGRPIGAGDKEGKIYGKYNAPAGTRYGDELTGRFPANLIHDNSEEVRECFPETKTGSIKPYKHNNSSTIYGGGKGIQLGTITSFHEGDSGSAARFFKSIIYQAKASKAGRGEGNNHPTVKPVALMEYLINMVTKEGGTVLDPFMGSGTTGVACKNLNRNFIGIELDLEYFKIAEKRINENL